jgi:hypothetical protein
LKRFLQLFTDPYEAICETKESGKLGLSAIIILVIAVYNGIVAPVIYYFLNHNDYELTLSLLSMAGIFALSCFMYLIDCGILWLAAKLCRQQTSFRTIAATWGFSFVPTLICSVIVNTYESTYYFFLGKPTLLFIINTIFILLLIWKAIFYFMECRAVLQLKGARQAVATIGIGILFALLIYADARLGLQVPML